MSRQREAYPPKTSRSGELMGYRERLHKLRGEEAARKKAAKAQKKKQQRGFKALQESGN